MCVFSILVYIGHGIITVISACDTLMKDTAYIFKMADKNKTKVIK
jgi:hypothetical protein